MTRWLRQVRGALLRRYLEVFGRIREDPVIVLGNQKSGTTAICRLLGKATLRLTTADIPPLWQSDPSPEEQLHAGSLEFSRFVADHRAEFSRTIIKDPALTFLMEAVLRQFPRARVLFVVRQPLRNIQSILRYLQLEPDTEMGELRRRVSRSWLRVCCGEWLGIRSPTLVESLAARWQLASDLHAAHLGENALTIRYEDFVADKEGTLRAAAEWCRLPVVRGIGRWLDHPFQPSASWGAADPHAFFTGEAVAAVERICARGIASFGYTGELTAGSRAADDPTP